MSAARLSWENWKAFVNTLGAKYVERPLDDGNLLVEAFHGAIERSVKLRSDTADMTDYVANYQGKGVPSFVDTDTGATTVSTKKLKPGFYFQCREIEWETGKLGSVHDKSLDQVDLGMTTLKFYDSSRTELVSPSQATLDSQCRYTKVIFNPAKEWGIRALLISHAEAVTQDCYVYGEMNILVDPAPVYLTLPQADGGLNLYFLAPHGNVGVDEDNFTYFSQYDFLTLWTYHPTGFNHRIQAKLKIALPIP